jgi:hypothetical protein
VSSNEFGAQKLLTTSIIPSQGDEVRRCREFPGEVPEVLEVRLTNEFPEEVRRTNSGSVVRSFPSDGSGDSQGNLIAPVLVVCTGEREREVPAAAN